MKQRVITALLIAPFALAAICLAHPVPLFTLLGMLVALAAPEVRRLVPGSTWKGTLLLLAWVLVPLCAMGFLHAVSISRAEGAWFRSPLLAIVVPVWAGDIAAIFAGKSLGKHKLAPAISPNKTWEGSIGHVLASILAMYFLARPLAIPEGQALVMGAISSVFAQSGDLFESWLKRRAGVKDSGALLPGHGGVLDRIDGLLFAAIPLVIWLLWLHR